TTQQTLLCTTRTPTHAYLPSLHDALPICRQGGGFTRAGGAGDQHQTARHIGNGLEDLAHAEVFHGQNLGRNGPEYRAGAPVLVKDRKSTRLNSSHVKISYAVFCLKKKIYI